MESNLEQIRNSLESFCNKLSSAGFTLLLITNCYVQLIYLLGSLLYLETIRGN